MLNSKYQWVEQGYRPDRYIVTFVGGDPACNPEWSAQSAKKLRNGI